MCPAIYGTRRPQHVPPEVNVLVGIPVTNGYGWKVWCPRCAAWHKHGAVEGYRVPHCQGADSLPQYYVVAADSPIQIPKPIRRRAGNLERVRRAIPVSVRFSVFKRDLFRCTYCGKKSPDVVLHIDHKIPVSAGGSNERDNLVTACQECNHGKGAM